MTQEKAQGRSPRTQAYEDESQGEGHLPSQPCSRLPTQVRPESRLPSVQGKGISFHFPPKHCFQDVSLDQGQANFCAGLGGKHFRLCRSLQVSVTAVWLPLQGKAATDNMLKGCGCFPITFYFQKREELELALGHSLLPAGPALAPLRSSAARRLLSPASLWTPSVERAMPCLTFPYVSWWRAQCPVQPKCS